MNLTPKTLRKLIFGTVGVVAIVLTFITLKIQKSHSKSNFEASVAQVTKNSQMSQNGSKTSKSNSVENSLQKFMNPSTNLISMDRQSVASPEYDKPTKDSDQELKPSMFDINSLKDVPKKGVVILFIYKPEVQSSKEYNKVISDYTNLINEDSKMKDNKPVYRVLNTKTSNTQPAVFHDFLTHGNKIQIMSAPNMEDLYAVGIKDGLVYTYITKTDTNRKSFNAQNLYNITYNLQNMGKDITHKGVDDDK